MVDTARSAVLRRQKRLLRESDEFGRWVVKAVSSLISEVAEEVQKQREKQEAATAAAQMDIMVAQT